MTALLTVDCRTVCPCDEDNITVVGRLCNWGFETHTFLWLSFRISWSSCASLRGVFRPGLPESAFGPKRELQWSGPCPRRKAFPTITSTWEDVS